MALKIVKSNKDQAKLVCIYSPDGFGKSSLAASAPTPLFFDIEKGAGQLDVDRVTDINSLDELISAINDFAKDPGDYKTLVIDSLTRVESFIMAVVPDPSFGRWGQAMAPAWRRLTNALDLVRAKDVNVVLIAHAWAAPFNDPTADAPFDKLGLRLDKVSAAGVREYVDAVFYIGKETLVKTTKGVAKGRVINTEEDKRILYTVGRPAFDAKSRYDLPSEIILPKSNGWQQIFASSVDATRELAKLIPLIKDEVIKEKVVAALSEGKLTPQKLLSRVQQQIEAEREG